MSQNQTSKNSPLFLGLVIVIVVGALISFYSGSMTGRWYAFSGQDDAKKVLRELPLTIGDWQADHENEMSSEEVSILQIQNGYVSRTYRHSQSRAVVHLIIMVGPTGRVVVHTPEICFGGKDYIKENERNSVSLPVASVDGTRDMDDTFWKVDFVNKSLDLNSRISFYYAVSVGDAWIATEKPRQTFQTYRYIYKLQAQAYAEAEADTVKMFLEDCLPTIHQYLRPCR